MSGEPVIRTDGLTKRFGPVTAVDHVELEVRAGDVCGELESTKAVSELYSPVTGTVTEVNGQLENAPDLVNSDAYGDGWIFKVELTESSEDLLDADAYGEKTE